MVFRRSDAPSTADCVCVFDTAGTGSRRTATRAGNAKRRQPRGIEWPGYLGAVAMVWFAVWFADGGGTSHKPHEHLALPPDSDCGFSFFPVTCSVQSLN